MSKMEKHAAGKREGNRKGMGNKQYGVKVWLGCVMRGPGPVTMSPPSVKLRREANFVIWELTSAAVHAS